MDIKIIPSDCNGFYGWAIFTTTAATLSACLFASLSWAGLFGSLTLALSFFEPKKTCTTTLEDPPKAPPKPAEIQQLQSAPVALSPDDTPCPLLTLPDELLLKIISDTLNDNPANNLQTIRGLLLTNKRLHRLVHDSTLAKHFMLAQARGYSLALAASAQLAQRRWGSKWPNFVHVMYTRACIANTMMRHFQTSVEGKNSLSLRPQEHIVDYNTLALPKEYAHKKSCIFNLALLFYRTPADLPKVRELFNMIEPQNRTFFWAIFSAHATYFATSGVWSEDWITYICK